MHVIFSKLTQFASNFAEGSPRMYLVKQGTKLDAYSLLSTAIDNFVQVKRVFALMRLFHKCVWHFFKTCAIRFKCCRWLAKDVLGKKTHQTWCLKLALVCIRQFHASQTSFVDKHRLNILFHKYACHFFKTYAIRLKFCWGLAKDVLRKKRCQTWCLKLALVCIRQFYTSQTSFVDKHRLKWPISSKQAL